MRFLECGSESAKHTRTRSRAPELVTGADAPEHSADRPQLRPCPRCCSDMSCAQYAAVSDQHCRAHTLSGHPRDQLEHC